MVSAYYVLEIFAYLKVVKIVFFSKNFIVLFYFKGIGPFHLSFKIYWHFLHKVAFILL